jgi:hypothetical protein
MNKNFKGAKIDIYSENTSPQKKKMLCDLLSHRTFSKIKRKSLSFILFSRPFWAVNRSRFTTFATVIQYTNLIVSSRWFSI